MTGRPPKIFLATFLAPALVLFTAFVAYPGIRAFLYSLQKWNGISDPQWTGLTNFVRLFRESNAFLVALGNNLILLLVGGTITIVLALTFAAMLHRKVRGAGLFRVAFFFPNVLAAVAVALIWMLLYSVTEFGVINGMLAWIQGQTGQPNVNLPYPFLDSKILIWSLIPMVVWMWTGFYMVLFLAAMQGIPESYYEAARLDGASPWQQFRYITLPMIRDVLTVGIVFLVITGLKFFDPVWVLENQRPTQDSHVMTTLLYEQVFTDYDVGYGSAIAVVLFLLVFVATLVSLRASRGEQLEY